MTKKEINALKESENQGLEKILLWAIWLTSPCALISLVMIGIAFFANLTGMSGLSEGEITLTNLTDETFTLTPVTTTYGRPQTIDDQLHIPIPPHEQITLEYNPFDLPLAGVLVCRNVRECRMVEGFAGEDQAITSFDQLQSAPNDWFEIAQLVPKARANEPSLFDNPLFYLISFNLVYLGMFAGWFWLKSRRNAIC